MTERMNLTQYRAYLKEQGFAPALITGLSQGGQQVAAAPKKRHKYNAKPVHDADGKQIYASRKEARRGAELELMQRQGLISGLKKQPRYRFEPNLSRGMKQGLYFDTGRVAEYWPDFEYFNDAGELIVEDVKGVRTPVYKIKKCLMYAYFGIEVTEI